jgi:hypothetical protein
MLVDRVWLRSRIRAPPELVADQDWEGDADRCTSDETSRTDVTIRPYGRISIEPGGYRPADSATASGQQHKLHRRVVHTTAPNARSTRPRALQLDCHRSIHLVIGPGGVFVIDSKQYRGRLQLDRSGRLWHGRYPLAPTLRAVSFEADQAAQVLPDPGVVVVPIVAVHGAQVPWGKVVMDGIPVVSAKRLPSMLRQLPAVLGPERVADLTNQARVRFHAA